MRIIYGNIFEEIDKGNADVVVHGCNCFCNMGAGIALDIKNKYPAAFLADKGTQFGLSKKLGTYSKANISSNGRSFIIINAYTQYDWNGNGVLVDYAALRQVFRSIKRDFHGLRIVYPLIGAGLAKGDWTVIERIIDEELAGELHYCVKLKK